MGTAEAKECYEVHYFPALQSEVLLHIFFIIVMVLPVTLMLN